MAARPPMSPLDDSGDRSDAADDVRPVDGMGAVRDRIARQRAATAERLQSLTSALLAVVESTEGANVDDEHDPEGATIAFERAQLGSLVELTRSRLHALDAADARIRAGTFGRCDSCGIEIPPERLVALPAADRCVTCAVGPRRPDTSC